MSLLSRTLAKIAFSDGCWLWTGRPNAGGYGRVRQGARGTPILYAHRVLYEALVGPVPAGLELDHLCRMPACVRPDHLEPVTHRENIVRGESPVAKQARKTHCKNGHELSAPTRRGRICRTCLNAYQREYRRGAAV